MKILVIGKKGRLVQYLPKEICLEQYDISYVPAIATDEEILSAGKDADILLVDAMSKVSGNVIRNMPNLKMIHSEGVGFQNFDVQTAKERNIFVCNCKAANAVAVAEQSILLMLALLRDAVNGDHSFRTGAQIQTKEAFMIQGNLKELNECTVGLLGLGDIAQASAKMLKAFGAEVIYHNRTRKKEIEKELQIEYVSKEELIQKSDIISIYLSANADTYHMVDREFLQGMKKGAYIVNTARGEIVDSKALVESLESGHLAGAGLDTVEDEPVKADNPFLLASDEVKKKMIFSCHIGGITGGAFRRCHKMFWNNVKNIEQGRKPDRIVNGL